MDWFKHHWYKLLGGIFIAFCLAYYFVILPQQKFEYQKYKDYQQEQEKKNIEKATAEKTKSDASSRTFCLSLASGSYLDRVKLNATSKNDFETWTWDSASARDYVEGKYKQDKDECYKKYPIQ